MKDNNVVFLSQTADGKFCRNENLPKPGTKDWSRHVLRNITRVGTTDGDHLELIVRSIDDIRLDQFVLLLIGNVVELLGTPQEKYMEKGKAMYKEIPEEPDVVNYMMDVIYDVCVYLGMSDEFCSDLFGRLLQGQIYTFWSTVVQTYVKTIKGNR